VPRIRNRDVRHDPAKDCCTLRCSVIPPWATPSWTVSFTTLIAFSLPEKACERRTPAIKLLTPTQTPEPITLSVKATAQDRVKYLLTIKRNERSPSSEIAAHHHRNAHAPQCAVQYQRFTTAETSSYITERGQDAQRQLWRDKEPQMVTSAILIHRTKGKASPSALPVR